MATVSRQTVWSNGDVLTSAALNQEFDAVVTGVNNVQDANIPSGAAIAPAKIAGTAVVAADILDEDAFTTDSATKPPSQQSTKVYIAAQIAAIPANTDGWTTATDTWVYVSASTFKIVGADRTALFQKGTRLKFTNSTVKYAVVVGSAFSTDTTVTIAVNTDYVLANVVITTPFYSYQLSPVGYPDWFNYTAIFTGFSINPIQVPKFRIEGKTCTVFYPVGGEGTSNATTLTMSVPVASANLGGFAFGAFFGRAVDNGTENNGQATLADAGSTTLICYKTTNLSAWTNTGTKGWQGLITYYF